MAAMKNRTVETESLAVNIGKTVTFLDEDTQVEETGKIISVGADGSYEVDTDSCVYTLTPDDVKFVEIEDEEENEVEEPDDTEEEDESEDNEGSKIEENVEENDEDVPDLTIDMIKKMDKDELKVIAKDLNIKVPLGAWKNLDTLRDTIINAIFGEPEKKTPSIKTEEKKSVVKKGIKGSSVSTKPVSTSKENKPKVMGKIQFIAKLFHDGGGKFEDLVKKVDFAYPEKSSTGTIFMINDYGKFCVNCGFLEKRDGGFYLKK